MLGLFAPKATHPLADERERQRVLGEIANADALSAVKSAVEWLKTLANVHGMTFAARAALIRQIDDAARYSAQSLDLEYLSRVDQPDAAELHLWQVSRSYWAQLAATYNSCLADFMRSAEKPENHRVELTRIAVRLMRAYRARMQWDRFRYWPASEALWQNMGRAFLHAVDNGYARREVNAYPGERKQTTVEGEYLNALVFQVSSMDALQPFEVHVAEAIVTHFAPYFVIGTEAMSGFFYWVDPEQRRAPGRVIGKLDPSLCRYYFGTARAMERLTQLQRMLEHGQIPSDLELKGYRSPGFVLPVVRHLMAYWTAHPPKRAHHRHRDHSQIAVVGGIESLYRQLAAGAEAATTVWTAENVSLGGVRARLPLGPDDQLRIGTFLGMRPYGGDNWLAGVVRRFAREDEVWATVGVETLSRNPIAVTVAGEIPAQAILLDPVEEGETVRLAVATFEPDRTLRVEVLHSTLVLEPVELLEPGVDFELGRYRVAGHG
jgi:hypothetical protein